MTEQKILQASRSGGLLDLLFGFEDLKLVERQNPLSNGNRRENTAEHSWSVALAAIVFQSEATEPIDVGHAVALAVTHDLPEAFVGDTFVYGKGAGSRADREEAAMSAFLRDAGPRDESGRLVALWREYESVGSAEARYVLALDVLLPVFMNSRNLEHCSWKRHQVQAEDVRVRVRRVQKALPSLAAEAFEAIDRGVRQGALQGP